MRESQYQHFFNIFFSPPAFVKVLTVSGSCAPLLLYTTSEKTLLLSVYSPHRNASSGHQFWALCCHCGPLHTAAGCRKTSALPQSVQRSAASSCPAATAPFRAPLLPPLLREASFTVVTGLCWLSPSPHFLFHFFLPKFSAAQTHPPLELHRRPHMSARACFQSVFYFLLKSNCPSASPFTNFLSIIFI